MKKLILRLFFLSFSRFSFLLYSCVLLEMEVAYADLQVAFLQSQAALLHLQVAYRLFKAE